MSRIAFNIDTCKKSMQFNIKDKENDKTNN